MNRILVKINRKVKKVIGDVRAVAVYPFDQHLYRKNTIRRFEKRDGKYAIVNLDRQLKFDDRSRYFYNICMFLERSGFKVIVRMSLSDFRAAGTNKFHKAIWKENYIFVRKTNTPKNTALLMAPGVSDHVFRFLYGFNVTQSHQFDCIASYPMHPSQYNYSSEANSRNDLENNVRTIRILFSGKTRRDMYSKERVKRFFNVMSRLEVIEFIKANFAQRNRWLKTESDKVFLNELIESHDTSNEIIISEVKTEQSDWLKLLSKTHFFICPPGARMPWSHNSVEAMSAGAIPILEYADLFHPPLQHMMNCLSYKNPAELQSAINAALKMDTSEIERLRKNVLDYYNEHLSVHSITKAINSFFQSANQELKVAIPFVPTLKEAKAIPARAIVAR